MAKRNITEDILTDIVALCCTTLNIGRGLQLTLLPSRAAEAISVAEAVTRMETKPSLWASELQNRLR